MSKIPDKVKSTVSDSSQLYVVLTEYLTRAAITKKDQSFEIIVPYDLLILNSYHKTEKRKFPHVEASVKIDISFQDIASTDWDFKPEEL